MVDGSILKRNTPLVFRLPNDTNVYMIGSEIGNWLNWQRGTLYKKYTKIWRRFATYEERCYLYQYYRNALSSHLLTLVLASEMEGILKIELGPNNPFKLGPVVNIEADQDLLSSVANAKKLFRTEKDAGLPEEVTTSKTSNSGNFSGTPLIIGGGNANGSNANQNEILENINETIQYNETNNLFKFNIYSEPFSVRYGFDEEEADYEVISELEDVLLSKEKPFSEGVDENFSTVPLRVYLPILESKQKKNEMYNDMFLWNVNEDNELVLKKLCKNVIREAKIADKKNVKKYEKTLFMELKNQISECKAVIAEIEEKQNFLINQKCTIPFEIDITINDVNYEDVLLLDLSSVKNYNDIVKIGEILLADNGLPEWFLTPLVCVIYGQYLWHINFAGNYLLSDQMYEYNSKFYEDGDVDLSVNHQQDKYPIVSQVDEAELEKKNNYISFRLKLLKMSLPHYDSHLKHLKHPA